MSESYIYVCKSERYEVLALTLYFISLSLCFVMYLEALSYLYLFQTSSLNRSFCYWEVQAHFMNIPSCACTLVVDDASILILFSAVGTMLVYCPVVSIGFSLISVVKHVFLWIRGISHSCLRPWVFPNPETKVQKVLLGS